MPMTNRTMTPYDKTVRITAGTALIEIAKKMGINKDQGFDAFITAAFAVYVSHYGHLFTNNEMAVEGFISDIRMLLVAGKTKDELIISGGN